MSFDIKSLSKNLCGLVNTTLGYVEKFQLLKPFELAFLVAVCFLAGRILGYIVGWGEPVFSGFWVIMSALLVYKDEKEISLTDIVQTRLLAVSLGVVAAFIVLSVFGVNYLGLLLAALLVAWACEFFDWQKYQQLALISLSVLVVSSYLNLDGMLWASAVGRILEAAIGMFLSYGVNLLFTYYKDGTFCAKDTSSEN